MISYVIVAQSEGTARALVEILKVCDPVAARSEEYHELVFPHREGYDRAFHNRLYEKCSELFRPLDACVQRHKFTVLVDQANLRRLDPTGETGWEAGLAGVILSFPEVRWVFGCPRVGSDYKSVDTLEELCDSVAGRCSLFSLIRPPSDPLFDGDGLRSLTRALLNQKYKPADSAGEANAAPIFPVRLKVAAAIDDEPSFAYFHAYAAFRFGFRSHAVSSEVLLYDLFGHPKEPNRPSPRPDDLRYLRLKPEELELTLEDLFMSFADHIKKDPDVSLSNLEHRDKQLPGLDSARQRLFISTGLRRRGDRTKWRANQTKWASLKKAGRGGAILYKPVEGIFGLWEDAGLLKRYAKQIKTGCCGFAEGFIWPPPHNTKALSQGKHSAPGRLLEITDRLILRARDILKDVDQVEEAVQGAVLATEALELLGGRTPTSSLEALSLKHRLEVAAGCMFYGTQFSLRLPLRLKEMQAEIRSIAQWFSPKRRREAGANAELGIVKEIARILRSHSQFKEEQLCLHRERNLMRILTYQKRPWLLPLRPLQWYIDFLVGSLPRVAIGALTWVLLSSLFLYGVGQLKVDPSEAVLNATSIFLGSGPSEDLGALANYLGLLMRLGGYLHLGIFISHLYTLESRR